MSKTRLLGIAAFLTLFTFVGHTIGTFSKPPAEAVEAYALYEQMQQTFMTFPMGEPKSYSAVFFGANFCLSFYLLVSGLIFVLFARSKATPTSLERYVLVLTSLGLLACGIVSVFCFFPLPAFCTGVGGVLGLWAARRA